MNQIAKEMNEILKKSSEIFYEMLSDFGKRIYMPKGIIVQTAEAKQKAKKLNATIGSAEINNEPLFLPSIAKYFNNLKPSQIFPYAPVYGIPELRSKWKEKIIRENPDIKSPDFISTPVVIQGLTHGIMIFADLFLNRGDEIIISDKLWENYNLMFEERYGSKVVYFDLFDKELKGFNLKSLDETIARSKKDKVIVLFNFPNNPTGYTPTEKEAEEIVKIIEKHANSGKKILVVSDDSYYGLLFEDNLLKGSIFSKFVGLHKNIACVKIDGFTKEDYVWGFRVGFITFADYDHHPDIYKILEQKVAGCIRSSISNCLLPSQSILQNALNEPSYQKEKEQNYNILKERAKKVKEIVYDKKYSDCWEVYPFNSGYFMCLKIKGASAEEVRRVCLEKYQVGVIALGDDIRVAFSSVNLEHIEELFEIIANVIREVRK
ncbi:MAG TPA: aminotransferase class I/II-fold pyridoxal phosphate-dependent enzyme [Spirochaetota bacterium]|nr:aminotransferase class I/II-fold pyridoxal phosphate-dependent enzyme [Spirochaetota bacterium]HPP05613.1 aminotransferase class I/II-fold pyridoxal phosphate-dependent enzyme [Spirochaetota bacterium]